MVEWSSEWGYYQGGSVAELAYILQILRKMWFVVLGIGLATCLVVISTNLATNDYANPSALAGDIENNFAHMQHDIGNSLGVITRVPSNVVHALNVKNLITPAAAMSVPTITPIAVAAPQTISPPAQPLQPVIAPAPLQAVAAKPAAIASVPPHPATANTYAWGNCTWWAALRRAEVNDSIPNSWGNAATWAERAAEDGYAVDHQPSPGAIMQTRNSAGGLGHVAFVESVDPDGTWHISEMNVLGLDVVDHKALSPAAAAAYSFIHDKI